MTADEQAIRALVDEWMAATRARDLPAVLRLMSDDVIFEVPGDEPFGRDGFVQRSQAMQGLEVDGRSEIQELRILGDWAWMRNRLQVTVKLPDGRRQERAGYTLTILGRNAYGKWVIVRDANLLAEKAA